MTIVSRLRPAPGCVAALCAVLALGGCGGKEAPAAARNFDPAMTAAIEAPIMTDPDLAQMNARFAALSPGGPADGSLPMFDVSQEEQQAARAEAEALAGGHLGSPPSAQQDTARLAAIDAEITLAARARRITGRPDCVGGAGQAMIWGARLPEKLPAYPRAHLREALGSDAKDCALRAASFMAGIPAADALGFYAAMARRAGFTLAMSRDGESSLLEGQARTGSARFGVLVRPGPRGTVLIDVVTLNV